LKHQLMERGVAPVTGAMQPDGSRPAPTPPEPALDLVEVWGLDSFPASDPPANW
jgi:hypothetical protein